MVTGALADLEVGTRDRRGPSGRDEVRVHAFQTGVNVGNETCLRNRVFGNRSWSVRPRKWFEFPIHVYVVEHPEGRFAIDTGLTGGVDRVTEPRPVRWLFSLPSGSVTRDEEIDAQMRATGLRPEDGTNPGRSRGGWSLVATSDARDSSGPWICSASWRAWSA